MAKVVYGFKYEVYILFRMNFFVAMAYNCTNTVEAFIVHP